MSRIHTHYDNLKVARNAPIYPSPLKVLEKVSEVCY